MDAVDSGEICSKSSLLFGKYAAVIDSSSQLFIENFGLPYPVNMVL